VAISSRIGAMALHGPHHSAQKSTRTGSSAEPISSSKVASDRVVMVDMEVGFLSERDGGGGGLVPLSQQRRGDRHSRRSVDQWAPDASSQRSASMAAMQPDPAAVMAWR